MKLTHKKHFATPKEAITNVYFTFSRCVRYFLKVAPKMVYTLMNQALSQPHSVIMAVPFKAKSLWPTRRGNSRPKTGLMAAKRGREMLASVLFEGSNDAAWFNDWLENHLFKEPKPKSTIIMDNAAFHTKQDIREISGKHGHDVLFLPPYSPDFNPIEQDFATIKKLGLLTIKSQRLMISLNHMELI